tara:strand:- start:559 stop:759 length:201 start_codon:yes stop_codon:yes gene_type:complete
MAVKFSKIAGTLKYDIINGFGDIEFNEDFLKKHDIKKIDLIADWISDLEDWLEQYKKMIERDAIQK